MEPYAVAVAAAVAVLESSDAYGGGMLVRVQLAGDAPRCHPGQFLLLRCGAQWSPYLRQPLFPANVDGRTITFWGNSAHNAGLAWLANQPPGTQLDLLGPLGKGFSLSAQQRRLLLVAEARFVSPLLALIDVHLARQGSVGLLLHAPTAAELLPPGLLPPAVEYYTATADRSAGQPETLDEVLAASLQWADVVCAAGSTLFLQHLKRQIAAVRLHVHGGFAQALAPVPLACGVGACLACLVDTGRGHHRACQRGPVFDLVELAL